MESPNFRTQAIKKIRRVAILIFKFMVMFSLFSLSIVLTGIYSTKYAIKTIKSKENIKEKGAFIVFIGAVLIFVVGAVEFVKYANVGFKFYNGSLKTIDKTISRFYK